MNNMTGATALNDPVRCDHCGGFHSTTCPRIKAIEYGDNGVVKRIEFHPPQPVVTGTMAGGGGPLLKPRCEKCRDQGWIYESGPGWMSSKPCDCAASQRVFAQN